ncbi:MAG: hypothetical protein NT062_10145 [Proteobacteria bacterium]|nr:hypothetical protein [Pseudomonadota bacterium]
MTVSARDDAMPPGRDATFKCTWCAPTATDVVSVEPATLLGGALLLSAP